MPLKKRQPLEHRPTQPELVDLLMEGHGSLVDADKVDGLHASEIARGGGAHVTSHAKGGGDPFDGARDQISFQLEQVATLPLVTMGRLVLFLTDGHIYIGTEVI
jgi:hypothetical protein